MGTANGDAASFHLLVSHHAPICFTVGGGRGTSPRNRRGVSSVFRQGNSGIQTALPIDPVRARNGPVPGRPLPAGRPARRWRRMNDPAVGGDAPPRPAVPTTGVADPSDPTRPGDRQSAGGRGRSSAPKPPSEGGPYTGAGSAVRIDRRHAAVRRRLRPGVSGPGSGDR